MFTLTVNDERVYQQSMDRVERRGESLDEVLRELLSHEQDDEAAQNTPVRRLLAEADRCG